MLSINNHQSQGLPPLEPSAINALKNAFDVYDPVSQMRSENFSSLEKGGVQLICIGERHFSPLLWKLQEIALQILASKQGSSGCVLLEGVKPYREVNREAICWSNVPHNLHFIGADSRFSDSNLTDSNLIDYNTRISDLGLLREEAVEELNQFLTNHPTKIQNYNQLPKGTSGIKRAMKRVLFTEKKDEEAFLAWKNKWDRTLSDKYLQYWGSIHEKKIGTNQKKQGNSALLESDLGLFSSNNNLFNQAVQKLKTHSVVYAIWGKQHFELDRTSFIVLHLRRIRTIVLLPKLGLEEIAKKENYWCSLDSEGILSKCISFTNEAESGCEKFCRITPALAEQLPKLMQEAVYPIEEMESRPEF